MQLTHIKRLKDYTERICALDQIHQTRKKGEAMQPIWPIRIANLNQPKERLQEQTDGQMYRSFCACGSADAASIRSIWLPAGNDLPVNKSIDGLRLNRRKC